MVILGYDTIIFSYYGLELSNSNDQFQILKIYCKVFRNNHSYLFFLVMCVPIDFNFI